MIKKKWKQPNIITLQAKELAKHIKVAARSGIDCVFSDFR